MDKRSSSQRLLLTPTADKLILVMVGLPARGKSFISRKIQNFLLWKGFRVRIFNVGQYRRKTLSGNQEASFFDPSNSQGKDEREKLAHNVAEEMLLWLYNGGDIALFDATNSTEARRKRLSHQFLSYATSENFTLRVVFVESICTDEQVLRTNMLHKIRSSPDYKHMKEELAMNDLQKRIHNYEVAYEEIGDDSCSYIKLFNLQSKVHANNIYGHVAKSLLPYMMSFHINHRPIWLVRAGHCSEVNMNDVGLMDTSPCVSSRSARLSEHGMDFAKRLGEFVHQRCTEWQRTHVTQNEISFHERPLKHTCHVMTSTLPRAVETASFIIENHPVTTLQYATLNPLDKGECYGLTMEQMRDQMPDVYEEYMRNPLRTRFPGGESYFDLMLRLEPILIEIEQQTGPVCIVSHISTLQVLYCYFLGIPIDSCSRLSIPFHSVVQVVPHHSGWTETIINLQK